MVFGATLDLCATSEIDALDGQIDLNEHRIEDLSEVLGQKRIRLEAGFLAMEWALAEFQSQIAALASFQPIPFSSFNNANNNNQILSAGDDYCTFGTCGGVRWSTLTPFTTVNR